DPQTVKPLICSTLGTSYSGVKLSSLRYKVLSKAGLEYNFRELRSHFGNWAYDWLEKAGNKESAIIEKAQKLLRHKTIVTTQKFYVRGRSTKKAWDELFEASSSTVIVSD